MLPFIGIHQSMHRFNKKRLANPKAIQYFNRYASYNGSDPYRVPATLSVIAYPEHFQGAFYPKGGMISITRSLVELAKDIGVRFHLGCLCEEIVLEGGKVSGVRWKNQFHPAELVVSNSDIHNTYRKLLPHIPLPAKVSQEERSSSAFIFYWGMNRIFEQLEVHNIFFSEDYRKEFREIWEEGTAPEEPTVYVNISSKYNPSDAPSGGENWFVMVNVPGNTEVNWDLQRDTIRSAVLRILSQRLKTDIGQYIVCEDTLNPNGIEARTASFQGSLYGSASNAKLSAFLRHSNRINRVKNLYCCGGSVHPGGGIPLALLSAKITTRLIPNA